MQGRVPHVDRHLNRNRVRLRPERRCVKQPGHSDLQHIDVHEGGDSYSEPGRHGQLLAGNGIQHQRHLLGPGLALLVNDGTVLVRFLKLCSRTGDSIPGLTAKRSRVRSKRHRSALALAESFGAPVFEPTWWPEDTRKVSYELDALQSDAMYRIGSTRSGGTPICVIGRLEKPGLHLPVGNWSPIPELEAIGGLVSISDDHVRAVVHQEQQTIHLIGYASEAEVVQAVTSFQRVPAESD